MGIVVQPDPAAGNVSAEILSALQRDLKVTGEQARARLVRADWAARLDPPLRQRLGKAFAGSWLAEDGNEFVVAITDKRLEGLVRASGATPRLVARSEAALSALSDRLEASARDAKRVSGAVTGWVVDPQRNQIRVQYPPGVRAAAEAFASAAGLTADQVTYEAVGAEVNRLQELRLTALEDLCDAELRLGRHGVVVAELERALVDNPLRERLVELLMRAQCGEGRPADALEAYQKLRTGLAEELGADPASHLQRLHTAILRQDPTLTRRELPDPAGPRPAQLPPRVGHFVGRGEQLAALHAVLDRTADTRVVVVSGAGGMGKTAVVVQWAHAVPDRFPDGQLFMDLRGHDDRTAMTAAAALTHALRALGVPEARLPGESAEQVSLLRSLLDGRRVLIVLDNAGSADHVLPLVPPSPASMLVVTSRKAMAALTTHHRIDRIALNALVDAEALELLADVVGAKRIELEPAEAVTIVTGCAGLPLALRMAAAKLLQHPSGTLRALADELSTVDRLNALDVEGDNRSVRAVFASAYRALSAPVALLFRRMGVNSELVFGPHLARRWAGSARSARMRHWPSLPACT